MKEEKEEITRQNGIVYVRGQMPCGFIYLEHLWRISELQGRQLWLVTALSSCLPLKDQQGINQSEETQIKCVKATDHDSITQLGLSLWSDWALHARNKCFAEFTAASG